MKLLKKRIKIPPRSPVTSHYAALIDSMEVCDGIEGAPAELDSIVDQKNILRAALNHGYRVVTRKTKDGKILAWRTK